MSQQSEDTQDTAKSDALQVPTKAEFLAVLQDDSRRAGMQLEWVYDHSDHRLGIRS